MRKQNKKHRTARKHKAGPASAGKQPYTKAGSTVRENRPSQTTGMNAMRTQPFQMTGAKAGGQQPRQKLAPNFSGQHLLHDPRTIGKLIDAARLKQSDTVLEIGAGKGHLTFPLAERVNKVIAAEIDADFVLALRSKAGSNPRIVIVHGDFREMRLPREPFCVVANIPFSITTPILEKLLGNDGGMFQRGVLVVEKGAARRFTQDPPRDPRAIQWQMYFRLEMGMEIDRTHFAPPPSVDAASLSIIRREKPLIMPGKGTQFLAFSLHLLRQPYQMAGDAFRSIFTPEQLKRALREARVDREQNVAKMSLEQWASLFMTMLQYVDPYRWPK